jgi:hypothetical protein
MSKSMSRLEILNFLSCVLKHRKTGRLVLSVDEVSREFYFLEGNLVHAFSSLPFERVETVVVEDGILSREYLEMISHYRLEGNALSSVLRAMHLVSRYEMKRQIEKLAVRIFLAALRWDTCRLEFVEGNFDLETDDTTDISLATLIVYAGRELKELDAAEGFLRSLKTPVRLNAGNAGLLAEAELTPEEGFLLSRVGNGAGIQDIVAVSGMDESRAYRILLAFVLVGVLEAEEGLALLGSVGPAHDDEIHKEAEVAEPIPVSSNRFQTDSFSLTASRFTTTGREISCTDLISRFLHETRKIM